MASITREELLSIAKRVRKNDIDNSHGQCYPASKTLAKKLAKETPASSLEIEVEEVLVGPSATIRHYVVAFPAEYLDDSVYGRVLIDITLDQYSTENEEQGKVKTSFGLANSLPKAVLYDTKEQSPYTG